MKTDTPFRAWRAKMKFTQAVAAKKLGRCHRQIAIYDEAERLDELPFLVRLGMVAREHAPEHCPDA